MATNHGDDVFHPNTEGGGGSYFGKMVDDRYRHLRPLRSQFLQPLPSIEPGESKTWSFILEAIDGASGAPGRTDVDVRRDS